MSEFDEEHKDKNFQTRQELIADARKIKDWLGSIEYLVEDEELERANEYIDRHINDTNINLMFELEFLLPQRFIFIIYYYYGLNTKSKRK